MLRASSLSVRERAKFSTESRRYAGTPTIRKEVYERAEGQAGMEDNDARLVSERTNGISLPPCLKYTAGERERGGISFSEEREELRDRAYPFYVEYARISQTTSTPSYHFVKSSICGINVPRIPTSC